MKKKSVTKIAFALSVVMLILWCLLGAGTTLAWFTDTTLTQKNTFIIGELDLEVSHKVEDGYVTVKTDTMLFDDKALYEPGYVQVVYLKIENNGNVDFDYVMSVDVVSSIPAINVFGDEIFLEKYLRFGVITADTESEVTALTVNRDVAKNIATLELDSFMSEPRNLEAGGEDYASLVVYMPENINNVANYRDDTKPEINLGITVKATQEGVLN